jgi:hypothetical protein
VGPLVQEIQHSFFSLFLTKVTAAFNYAWGQLLAMSHSADQDPGPGSLFHPRGNRDGGSFAVVWAPSGAVMWFFVGRAGTD